MNVYMCVVCGFIYDEAAGRPEDGIALGRGARRLGLPGMQCRQGRLHHGAGLNTTQPAAWLRDTCTKKR